MTEQTQKPIEQQSNPAVANMQLVMTNLRVIKELQEEDLNKLRDEHFATRVSLKHSNNSLEQHKAALNQEREHVADLQSRLKEVQSNNENYSKRLQSLVWHISQLAGKEIDQEYLAEVYEMWENNNEAKKRRENQNSVRDAVREQQGREADIPETVAEIDNTIDQGQQALESHGEQVEAKAVEGSKQEPEIDVVDEPVQEAREPKTLHVGRKDKRKTKNKQGSSN